MSNVSAAGERCVVIESIGTANPPFAVAQRDAAAFMLRTSGLSASLLKRIPQVYDRSGIDSRYTCLEDYTRTFEQFDFYPKSPSLCPSPGIEARNNIYKRESVPLAENAARECIEQSTVQMSEITHLIVVSCTGFFAPGIDIHLVKLLGLSPDTERMSIGFMGCYAAFNGLKTAAAICRSRADAKVLVVCVELCTLHFQIEDTLESVIVNALFSDGAAACLLHSMLEPEAAGKLIYRDAATVLENDSLDAMSWEIGDKGFIMGLSPKVPELIANSLPAFLKEFTQKNQMTVDDISFWAVHPGGRQVLDRTASTMNIAPKLMDDSYAILRTYGNMSSPTILFILSRILQNQEENRRRRGVALAFGPGLTIEGCLLEFGQ